MAQSRWKETHTLRLMRVRKSIPIRRQTYVEWSKIWEWNYLRVWYTSIDHLGQIKISSLLLIYTHSYSNAQTFLKTSPSKAMEWFHAIINSKCGKQINKDPTYWKFQGQQVEIHSNIKSSPTIILISSFK